MTPTSTPTPSLAEAARRAIGAMTARRLTPIESDGIAADLARAVAAHERERAFLDAELERRRLEDAYEGHELRCDPSADPADCETCGLLGDLDAARQRADAAYVALSPTPADGGRTVSRRFEDACRTIRSGTSAAMKRLAKVRTCPECKRGNALIRRVSSDGAVSVARCRWCGFERESSREPAARPTPTEERG